MANMIIYHNYILSNDTTNALKKLEAIIKFNPSLITAEAHYQIASILLAQNKLSQAEKTAFDVIKKQSAYEYWVTKTYILLGDIYLAQKDEFNAIATYKSVIENGTIAELKQIATDKLNLLSAKTNNKN
jgi:predicted negative regulator of RcsB-dependent stress response